MPHKNIIPRFLYVFLTVWFYIGCNDIFSYFIFSHDESRILSGIGLALLFSIPTLFIKQWLKLYLFIFLLLSLIPSLIFFIHLLLYKCPIINEVYYVLYESSLREVLEFFYQNLRSFLLLLIIAYSLFPFLLIKWVHPFKIKTGSKFSILSAIVCYCSVLIIFPLHHNINLIRYNNYLLDFVLSPADYKKEKEKLTEYCNIRNVTSNFEVTEYVEKDIQPVYVIVIGESTSKYHLNLYGYSRQTNPLLSKIKDEIYVFKNVISAHAHTIACLKEVLTFSNRADTLSFYKKESMIELFNRAGFETYWISNQRGLGINESFVTAVAKQATHTHFTQGNALDLNNRYDEAIFPYLKNVLSENTKKKIIFIHLMGTHQEYRFRYPEHYGLFKDASGIKSVAASLGEEKINTVNAYDNAVLYNDYIISSIIHTVKKVNNYSFVLYFSDHGEEVYKDRDFLGHSEGIKSKYMTGIPFLLWLSPQYYKQNNDRIQAINSLTDRHYCTEDVIHSILDLAKIKTADYDETRSIFSSHFIERNEYLH